MSTETAPPRPGRRTAAGRMAEARSRVYAVGLAAALPAVDRPLADADGRTLAEPLTTRTDLPAFPTSSVDGWAVRGTGAVAASSAGCSPAHRAAPLTADGTCVEIATGAMVPDGHRPPSCGSRTPRSTPTAVVTGAPRPDAGVAADRARRRAAGEELLPAGTPVDPGVIGLAAACGYDTLPVRRQPRGRAAGLRRRAADRRPARRRAGPRRARPAGAGVAAPLRRHVRPTDVLGPVADTLDAHVAALRGGAGRRPTWSAPPAAPCTARSTTCIPRWPSSAPTTSSTPWRSGPASRCCWPRLTGPTGGPASSPGCPATRSRRSSRWCRWSRRCSPACTAAPLPALPQVTLGAPIPGRGDYTHLALVRLDPAAGSPTRCRTSARRCCAGWPARTGSRSSRPAPRARPGTRVPFVPLPLLPGERA